MAGDVSAKYVHQDKGPDYPIDVHSFWFIHEAATTQLGTASGYGFSVTSPSYGANIPQAPYAPVGADLSSGYGMPQASAPYPPTGQQVGYGLYPDLNVPPPTYNQATGYSEEKK